MWTGAASSLPFPAHTNASDKATKTKNATYRVQPQLESAELTRASSGQVDGFGRRYVSWAITGHPPVDYIIKLLTQEIIGMIASKM